MSDYTAGKIREYRKIKGWTQQKLADECGISLMSIRRYETTGKNNREPKISDLMTIADKLGVDVVDLVGVQTFETPEEFEKAKQEIIDNSNGGESVTIIHKASPEFRINTALDKLNDSGKNVAADRVEELTEIKKYQK